MRYIALQCDMSLSRREKEFISYSNFFLRNYISFDIQTNKSRLRSKHITKPPKCLSVSILEVFFQLRSVPADTPVYAVLFFIYSIKLKIELVVFSFITASNRKFKISPTSLPLNPRDIISFPLMSNCFME